MTTLAEAYQEAYEKDLSDHNQTTPLDFESVQTLPESHVWHDQSHEIESSAIPIIDLHDPNVIKLIRHASETWGVFELTAHGIPLKLVKDVEEEARRLFSLPFQHKMQALRTANGATGYGIAKIAKFYPKLMWHEGFTIMGSPAADAVKLWPNHYIHFCDVMESYQKKMREALNIPRQDVKWVTSSEEVASTGLQLNSYPPCPDHSTALGLAPHTDTSLFTLLHQLSNTNGLQILKDGKWFMVAPVNPHALLVNLGDLLHLMSNGRFTSVVHRAAVNQNGHRLSAAYFYTPPVEYELSALCLEGLDQLPLYRTLKVKEYVALKVRHFDKALYLVKNKVDDMASWERRK
ncbi:Isopenicillin N synthase-like, Fe(2+) 2OG dioxygenase domain [Dillenia turbinata]|uniref:Isopenicillin N synthase-like, Fe(2+) 2OG dioxygenase domain n=1 Tax=Dillenia turbinata TaxID=194707 RepID=A0AAN8UK68_9MAGN